jgi:gamma-glutamylcyclotransferase (GGCT)/AIG2-like uncharacterized protein YtfP
MFDPFPYAAYGSNLDHARMGERCPGAEPAGGLVLPGWRLVLGRFATIAPDPGAALPIGLWRVTARHIAALDRAEGTALGIYERVRLALPGGAEAWTYIERRARPGPPEAWYVGHLRQGYRAFGLDPSPLEAALALAGFRDSTRVM